MVTLAKAERHLGVLDPPVREEVRKVLTAVVDYANSKFTLPAHIYFHRIALEGDTVHIERDDLTDTGGQLKFEENVWTGPLLAYWLKQDLEKYPDHRITGLFMDNTGGTPLRSASDIAAHRPSEHLVIKLAHRDPTVRLPHFWLS